MLRNILFGSQKKPNSQLRRLQVEALEDRMVPSGGLIGDLSGEGDYLHGGQVIAANPKVFSQMVQALSPFRAALERDRAAATAAR